MAGAMYKIVYHAEEHHAGTDVHSSACAIEQLTNVTVIDNLTNTTHEVTGLTEGTEYHFDVIAVHPSNSREIAYFSAEGATATAISADQDITADVEAGQTVVMTFTTTAETLMLHATSCAGGVSWELRKDGVAVHEFEYEVHFHDEEEHEHEEEEHEHEEEHEDPNVSVYSASSGAAGDYELRLTAHDNDADVEVYFTENVASWPFPVLPGNAQPEITARTLTSVTLEWPASTTAGTTYKIVYHAEEHHAGTDVHSSACAIEEPTNVAQCNASRK